MTMARTSGSSTRNREDRCHGNDSYGAGEDGYDRASERIYQNIKSNSTVQVIDPTTNKVEKTFNTAPATGPHGLAVDSAAQRLYTAGSNGKLVVIDLKTGKVISTVDIEKGVDQIAYDRTNKNIYCACKGAISVAQATDDGAKLIGNVPRPKAATPSLLTTRLTQSGPAISTITIAIC